MVANILIVFFVGMTFIKSLAMLKAYIKSTEPTAIEETVTALITVGSLYVILVTIGVL